MDEKVIKVFISSTFEDLEEERKMVYTAILETNATLSTNKIVLLPVDMRHGASSEPPLDECLREVASSQVLIGLIGLKYGTVDPPTGKSFSELEYDEAKKQGIPTLMYVREAEFVKPEWVETDADKQAKIETFKRKIDCKRDSFKSCEQLRGNIIRDLPSEVLKKHPPSEGKAIESPEAPTKASDDKIAPSGEKLPASIKEVNQLVKFIGDNLSNLDNVDGLKRRRLLLLAASMFYGSELSGTLGTHEVHLLYCERKNMSLLGREKLFLIRNAFADTYGVKAGWFWVKDFASKDLLTYLCWLCVNEGDEDTRIGCIQLLKHFWSSNTEYCISQGALSTKKKICMKALEVLEESASENCLDTLEKAAANQDIDIKRAATRAKLTILARYDPSKAASFIEKFENEYATGDVSALSNIIPKLKVNELKKLKEHKDEKIKRLALVELVKRGELDDNDLKVLMNNSDGEVKYLAYKGLINKGEKFNVEDVRKSWPKQNAPFGHTLLGGPLYRAMMSHTYGVSNRLNEIIEMILKTYSVEELEKALTWMSLDGKQVYLELGLRKGRENLKQVREDLDNKFDRIKKAYVKHLESLISALKQKGDTYNVARVQSLIDQFGKESQKSGENEFTRSALKILMEHGEKEDMRFAKQFITSDDREVKEIATELFVKLADKDELSKLVEITLNDTREIREKAALKALAIDKEGSVLETFLKSNNSLLIRLYFNEKLKREQLLEKGKIEQLLLNADEEIRKITVAYLVKILKKKRKKLEQTLDKYLENQTYYYNTVCWLDRILYAPSKFRELYKKQLYATLGE